jgi:putative SOS response-associated peptidase YedK
MNAFEARQEVKAQQSTKGEGDFALAVTVDILLFYDRMPVILDPDSYDVRLDPGMMNVAAASDLLKPFDARLMRCYPVSTRINHIVNDGEECSRRVDIAEAQNRLFA